MVTYNFERANLALLIEKVMIEIVPLAEAKKHADATINAPAKASLPSYTNKAIIPLTDAVQLNRLHPTLATHITPDRYKQLTEEMIPHLPQTHLMELNPEQMDHLTHEQVQGIEDRAIIRKLHTTKLLDLSHRQISQIHNNTLLGRLYPKQIPFTNSLNTLPNQQYKHLGETQIPQVMVSKFHLLTANQLQFATDVQVTHIDNPIVIQKLQKQQVRALRFKQLVHIHPHQLADASPLQITVYVISAIAIAALAVIALIVLYKVSKAVWKRMKKVHQLDSPITEATAQLALDHQSLNPLPSASN